MGKALMGTVDKALALLRHFSVQKPEFGLSELARMAGYDKTTTLRCMTALERHGFVEQDSVSRKYRLGLALFNLARIREQSFPIEAVIKPHLDQLAARTGETAHATLLSGTGLLTIQVSEPDRALRVYVDPGDPLPVHATASGLAVLAFMPDDKARMLRDASGFERFTDETPTDPGALDHHVRTTRQNGFARSVQTYETDVTGTAAPFFGSSGDPIGAIAVAAVSARFDGALALQIETGLRDAASAITAAMGGVMPALIETPRTTHEQETPG